MAKLKPSTNYAIPWQLHLSLRLVSQLYASHGREINCTGTDIYVVHMGKWHGGKTKYIPSFYDFP